MLPFSYPMVHPELEQPIISPAWLYPQMPPQALPEPLCVMVALSFLHPVMMPPSL